MLKKLKLLVIASILVAPLILSPIKASAATTVAITSPTSGEVVTGTSFTVTGTATADRLITVEVDGTEVGTTTSDGSGDWSLEVTGQDAGEKTITATASVQYAYVTNGNAATMSVINTITDEVVNTVTTGVNQNGSVVVSPDGSQAVSVSGYGGDNTIKVYSLADPEAPVITNNLTAPDTYAISAKYSPDGTYFVVNSVQAGFGSSTVTRHTSASPATTSPVTGYDQTFPAGMSYNSSGSTLYVSNVISGTMSVIDTASNTQTSTFSTGGATYAGNFALSSDDINGYVSANNQDRAIPVDVGGPSAGTEIVVGDGPQDLIYNSDESRIFIANNAGNTVSSINTANNTVVDTVATGTQPRNFARNSNYSKLYLTLSGDDTVAILNPSTLATTGTITVGDQPAGISVGPVESASDSTTFTLAAASSASDETLADTGQNTYLYLALASSLLIVPALYFRKRYTSK